ncbi:hypothetical protein [Brachybacterium sp. p3-SID957]|uniref:hypothetical protein n=1 Tax=Brachybacterium sp. p3-SID957 TaxID=2916049 RepID=UPI00223AB027|nr:hypothetical protein [Brachybacterium sp. p3-SID957]MCT1777183.1 hypothetical protein [Brachybacterium sp. p3-SID957]
MTATAIRLEVADHSVLLTFGPGLETVAEEIDALWSHLRATGDGDATPQIRLDYVLTGGDLPAGTVPLPARPEASYTISGHLTREVIRRLIGTRLLLHAGAVAHPELGTLVLVGASGAGKSTASSLLGRDGAYLTDELTIITPGSFALTPYPKPVSKHDPQLGAKRDFALGDLGLRPADEAAAPAPAMVLLLERIRDESEVGEGSSVTRVPLSEALTRIVPQTSSLWELPGGLAALAGLLDSVGGALEVRYREAAELEELLRRLPPAEHVETAEIEPRPGDAAAGEDTAPAPGRIAAVPFHQALAVESGLFLLGEHGAIHLPGLAGLVWNLLADAGPLTFDQLEQLVVEEIGEHPKSATLVRSTVADLVDHGWARQG